MEAWELTAQVSSGQEVGQTDGALPGRCEVVARPGRDARKKRVDADLGQHQAKVHGGHVVGHLGREGEEDGESGDVHQRT